MNLIDKSCQTWQSKSKEVTSLNIGKSKSKPKNKDKHIIPKPREIGK